METTATSSTQWARHAEAVLRAHGHPVTAQRVALLELLAGRTDHPSAAVVLEALPAASRATVYKTLALLVELGLCTTVSGAGGETRFDVHTEPHGHLLCTRCGTLSDLPAGPVDLPALPEGFVVRRARVFVEGICASCA